MINLCFNSRKQETKVLSLRLQHIILKQDRCMHIEDIYSTFNLVELFCRRNTIQGVPSVLLYLCQGSLQVTAERDSEVWSFNSEKTWPRQNCLITASLFSPSHSAHLLPPTSVMQRWQTLLLHSMHAQTHNMAPPPPQNTCRHTFQTVLQWQITHRACMGGPDNPCSIYSPSSLSAALSGEGQPHSLWALIQRRCLM